MNPNMPFGEDISKSQGIREIVDTFLSIANGIIKDIDRLQSLVEEVLNCPSSDAPISSLQDDIHENVEELKISLRSCIEAVKQSEWLAREIRSFDSLEELSRFGDLTEIGILEPEYE